MKSMQLHQLNQYNQYNVAPPPQFPSSASSSDDHNKSRHRKPNGNGKKNMIMPQFDLSSDLDLNSGAMSSTSSSIDTYRSNPNFSNYGYLSDPPQTLEIGNKKKKAWK